MIGLVPFRINRPRLGQVSGLVSGMTSNLAKQIVQEAEPVVRRIVHDERNRLVEALSGGLPFGAIAAVGYVGTSYLVPDGAGIAKAVGYSASAAALGVGAWLTFRKLTEKPAEPEAAAASPSGPPPEIVQQAAKTLVQEAEPRIRQIVDEERARAATALQAGLPFAGAAAAAFLATMLLVGSGEKTLKAVGYSATALLLGAGAWIALEKEKEAAA